MTLSSFSFLAHRSWRHLSTGVPLLRSGKGTTCASQNLKSTRLSWKASMLRLRR